MMKTKIPVIYREDSRSRALQDTLDSGIGELAADVWNLERVNDPARVNRGGREELGEQLNAGFLQFDSDRVKREKILRAVQQHRVRGTWAGDVKAKVDVIAGGNASIINLTFDTPDWIMSDGVVFPQASYWGTMGHDGVDDDTGLVLTGSGDELWFDGIILIDIDNPAPTPEQIDALVETLQYDVLPAYYRIYLGHDDGTGFVTYHIIA